MTPTDALLDTLPGTAWAFGLVLARVGSAVLLMPGIAEAEIPPMPRMGIAAAIAIMLLEPLRPALPPVPDSPLNAAAILIAEIATGLWFGWLARLPALALPIAGQMMSFLLGLSSVLVPAAGGQEQTALARLFGLAAPVLVFAAGLHRLALAALAGSYHVIPPGTLLPAGDAAETVVGGVATCFALAFRLAAPFVIASVLWQVAIGLASRLVPRLQIYVVSLPGQILGGFLLLGLVGSALLSTWSEAARQATLRLPGL